ncbi:cupin domain-containing protein [Nocardia aobensis]|uniref:cupin domain-containing protein n=1 Tax=Nocardia aobensis TaxID=257277 RepID=UPI00055CB5C6|nr:cupin domain-containing protein [Nocardia aobensis]
MSIHGLYVAPGEGKRLVSAAHEVVFKVTGEHSTAASSFEVLVPPGFDVGAHLHHHSEELFYLVEGELEFLAFEPVSWEGHWSQWRSEAGRTVITAGPGSVVFVPPGCPHAFRNASDAPAKMFFQASPPPDHEHYFEGLIEIFRTGAAVDPAAVAALRRKYDIEQISELRYQPPGE